MGVETRLPSDPFMKPQAVRHSMVVFNTTRIENDRARIRDGFKPYVGVSVFVFALQLKPWTGTGTPRFVTNWMTDARTWHNLQVCS